MIHMRDVSKIYENGAVALDHVNVDIEAGDFVFIVGASGAGKSTFIKMLFREELPSSGSLFVNGRDVVHMKRSEVPYSAARSRRHLPGLPAAAGQDGL